VSSERNIPTEIQAKLRQFTRVLMSYGDFKHARLVSSYILDENLHSEYPNESFVLLPALNCAMIMSHCRPFSGNDARTRPKVPDLPSRFLDVLNDEERIVHDTVMQDRNKVLAHSDSDALQMEPVLMRINGGEILAPLTNWGLAPLTEEATATFSSAAQKLLEATFRKRERLEHELRPYLRVVDAENLFDPPG